MARSPDPDVAQFLVSEACKAAGITPATFRNWTRGDEPAVLLTQEDRSAAETGSLNLLSFRRVMQLCIVAHLVERHSMLPRKAAMVAVGFTDTASSARWAGEQAVRSRLPGEMYPKGLTILLARPTGTGTTFNIDPSVTTFMDVLFRADTDGLSTVAVNINGIDRRVRSALGLDMNWGRSEFERGVG